MELLELGRKGGRREERNLGVHQAGITVFPLVTKSWWSGGIQTAFSSGIISTLSSLIKAGGLEGTEELGNLALSVILL